MGNFSLLGRLFKACGSNVSVQIAHVFGQFRRGVKYRKLCICNIWATFYRHWVNFTQAYTGYPVLWFKRVGHLTPPHGSKVNHSPLTHDKSKAFCEKVSRNIPTHRQDFLGVVALFTGVLNPSRSLSLSLSLSLNFPCVSLGRRFVCLLFASLWIWGPTL